MLKFIAVAIASFSFGTHSNPITLTNNLDHVIHDNIALPTHTFLKFEIQELEKHAEQAKINKDNTLASHLYFDIARIYGDKLEDPKTAITYLDGALRYNPANGEAMYYRGLNYYFLEDYASASINLSKAVQLNPKLKGAYLPLGLSHYELGDYTNTLEVLNKYIEYNPENLDPYHLKGLAYSMLGDTKNAITYLDYVIEQDNTYEDAYFNLATIYSDKGEYDKAKYNYLQSIALAPNDSASYLNHLEINLITNEAYNIELSSAFVAIFLEKRQRIIHDMLAILSDIYAGNSVNLIAWQQKYQDTKIQGWSFAEIEHWIHTTSSTTKERLLKALNIFKNHNIN